MDTCVTAVQRPTMGHSAPEVRGLKKCGFIIKKESVPLGSQ